MRFISRGRPLGPDEVDEIVGQSLEMWERFGFGPWAAIEKATGRWIGRIGLNELPWWPRPHKIEVGFELHREFWNQGFATEGARAALGFGFEDHELDRIISAARSDHAASRRVMEKIGLAYQGVIDVRGTEVAWYALDRKEWRSGSQL
jgi:ribosomal-protein-alanine N-acetyltransferase